MAAVYPLVMDQGETFRLMLTYALPPEVEGGDYVPIDLTGATGHMQVRERYGAPVLAEATTDNGGITIDGPAGTITLVLTAVQTDAIGAREGSTRPREKAVYDLEIVLANGDVKRVIQGELTISPNITRSAVVVATPEA